MSDFTKLLLNKTEEINQHIVDFLPKEESLAHTVFDAMHYSVAVGGKRLRPMLVMETYRLFGHKEEALVWPFAAAIEMIHTYSLVHDDLPAMDNDDYRRGNLTTHKKYGEAMGILTGDALLNLAYETGLKACVCANSHDEQSICQARCVEALQLLAMKAGVFGMVGGQAVDVESEKQEDCPITREKLDYIYERKTGALIEASMGMGAILAGASSKERTIVQQLAYKIGLAFQIQDDVLDVIGDEAVLGKPIGSDDKNGKPTYVTYEGLEQAKEDVRRLSMEAIDLLHQLPGNKEFLEKLICYLISRDK